MGLCQYYRRFVPNFSAIAAPLHTLTKKGTPFFWSPECQAAFEQLKDALVGADVLALPRDEGQFILDCDASDTAIGAVLSQVQDGHERPICYASQLYDRHQRNYNVTRKEMLALVTFVRKFRQYLLGRPFLIRTDHAALQWLKKTPEPIGQQARWLEILEEFDYEVQHRPGTQHTNADALSRRTSAVHTSAQQREAASRHSALDTTDPAPTADSVSPNDSDAVNWAALQKDDPYVGEVYQSIANQLPRPSPETISHLSAETKTLFQQYEQLSIMTDGILCRSYPSMTPGLSYQQIVVPRPLRVEVADNLHRGLNGGHLGDRRSKAVLRKRFYWPGWSADVRAAKLRCRQCARYHRPRPQRQGHLQPLLRRLNAVNYSVQRNPRLRPWTVHVDKLKPYYEAATDSTEPPPTEMPQSPVQSRPRRNIRRPARYR